MSYFCIKIGENATSDYERFHQLYKHLDIVDIVDVDPGRMVWKEFLVIDVDMSQYTKKQIDEIKTKIFECEIDADGQITTRRTHNIDMNKVDFLDVDKKVGIYNKAIQRRQINENMDAHIKSNKKASKQALNDHKQTLMSAFDMRDIEIPKVDAKAILGCIIHKKTGEALSTMTELANG